MYQDNCKEIENLINNYFEGIFYGNTSSLETCFNVKAYIYGDINSNEYFKSVGEYVETVKGIKSPNSLGEKLKMSTVGIDVLGKITMVKLDVPMFDYNYYDFLSLFKLNCEWKIVNKLFANVV